MNQSPHLDAQFDEDLQRLRSYVLQMGGLLEAQIHLMIEAYTHGQETDLATIIEGERKINELELVIDDDCNNIIALRQPTASDLRLIMGISKMVTHLERSGDEVKKIAKAIRRIHESGHQTAQFGYGIRHIAETALDMTHQALDALARSDIEQAQTTIHADADLDIAFKSITRELITHMMEDPRTITTALEIMTIARAIERIGDHAKNICEYVIYVIEGRDVRHSKRKAQ